MALTEEEEKRIAMRAVKRQEQAFKTCDPDLVCPTCSTELLPEHAHYKCPQCGYRDSCCF